MNSNTARYVSQGTNFRRQMNRLILWFVLTAVTVQSRVIAATDEYIDVVVILPSQCAAATKLVTYNFPLATPNEVNFLIGPSGTIRPLAVNVNGDISGASNGSLLRVSRPEEYDLSAGIVSDEVQNRLVVDRQKLCDTNYNLQITYELKDETATPLPKLRAHLALGSETGTRLTAAGQAASLKAFDSKFGPSLKFFVSDAFQWFSDGADVRSASATQSAAKQSFETCYGCTGRHPLGTQLALAQLLDKADPKLIIPDATENPLSSWPGDFEFRPGRILHLKFGPHALELRPTTAAQPIRRLVVSKVLLGTQVK